MQNTKYLVQNLLAHKKNFLLSEKVTKQKKQNLQKDNFVTNFSPYCSLLNYLTKLFVSGETQKSFFFAKFWRILASGKEVDICFQNQKKIEVTVNFSKAEKSLWLLCPPNQNSVFNNALCLLTVAGSRITDKGF